MTRNYRQRVLYELSSKNTHAPQERPSQNLKCSCGESLEIIGFYVPRSLLLDGTYNDLCREEEEDRGEQGKEMGT